MQKIIFYVVIYNEIAYFFCNCMKKNIDDENWKIIREKKIRNKKLKSKIVKCIKKNY